jgi:DNA-binding response OmpR family regulator/HD-like signal output (HDOD) protein
MALAEGDMSNILVVDDTAFWRDVVSDALRLQHHAIRTSPDGASALVSLQLYGADLIVLDVDMPEVKGLSFLQRIRRENRWKNLPVIMLTGDMQKEHVLMAKNLGVVDYLLKARFSPKELLERVRKHAISEKKIAVSAIIPPATASTVATGVSNQAIPQLMTPKACKERVKVAMSGRTFAGVIADVIASADSPKMDLLALSISVGRDAVLTARVLQAANSDNNVSARSRGPVSNLPDAVRVVGCTGVRNIAATIGVFDAMPPAENGGFDPIPSWKHSIAVAKLCENLALADLKGGAYLVGLCHDLGEILFRSHFAAEYRQLLDLQKATGLRVDELEEKMLGATSGDISKEIIEGFGLPESIRKPIDLFHRMRKGSTASTDPVAKILQIADSYATGCLLASSAQATVRAFSRSECSECTGICDPPRPDDAQLRREVLAMTSKYAGLSIKDGKAVCEPVITRSQIRLLVIRDPSLSTFDPITAAVELMATACFEASLPSAEALKSYDGVVIIARNSAVPGMALSELDNVMGAEEQNLLPILMLTAKKSEQPRNPKLNVTSAQWPISISELQMFIQSIETSVSQIDQRTTR